LTTGEIKDWVVRSTLRNLKESLEKNGYRYREIMYGWIEGHGGRSAIGLCCDMQSFIVKYINNEQGMAEVTPYFLCFS
jgi:hypothetical protein